MISDEQLKWDCVAHFLNSLYQDMLHERKAGERPPCTRCIHLKECNSHPPFNLDILKEKSNIEIDYWFDSKHINQ